MPLIRLNNQSISSVTALPYGVGGKVLQVVQSTNATQVANNTSSMADTGLSGTITPTSSSSKILIIAHQAFGKNADNNQIDADLLRGSTTILSNWLNDHVFTNSASYNFVPPSALVYLDSPSTTSATVYKTQFRNAAGNSTYVFAQVNSSTSVMNLLEIAN